MTTPVETIGRTERIAEPTSSRSNAAGAATGAPLRQRGGRRSSIFGEHLFISQPERLIQWSRLLFASFGFLAIYLDPTRPAGMVTEIYLVLAIYLSFAILVLLLPSRWPLNDPRHCLTHAADILVLGLLGFLSEELGSPFFAFFTFPLITAAMRWGVLAAIVTALALDGLLIIVGWPYIDPSQSDLNTLIMRSGFALVAAALLGYFASYKERSRRLLTRLAAWPAKSSYGAEGATLADSLRHVSDVLDGVSLLVVWTEQDEPIGGLVLLEDGNCVVREVPADICQGMIERRGPGPAFAYGPLASAIGCPESLLAILGLRQLADRHDVGGARPTLCAVPFRSARHVGLLHVIDPGPPTEEMFSLAEIVALRLASELEQLAMLRELAEAAGWRARAKLGRDLHDSVLQDLTAAAFQLRAAGRCAPEDIRTALDTVGYILAEQQRRIRGFVDNARSPREAPPGTLREQMIVLARALSRQWRCDIHIDVTPPDLSVSGKLSSELCQIVSEATANAVRHGRARQLDVAILSKDGWLDLAIRDDGTGLASPPAADPAQPKSIRERVQELGGETMLLASASGLHISLRLPL